MLSNLDRAGNSLMYELGIFSETIKPQDRDWFFDPRNRDEWVAAFCRWLSEKQRKSAEVRASND